MTSRQKIKHWLHNACPGFAGRFPYFGSDVYFPKGSIAFAAACEQGIYECANIAVMREAVRDGGTIFDVGANIGLMALPILQSHPECFVVSFEPSPNAAPWLAQTIEKSRYRERWTLIPKAVGGVSGTAEFSVGSPEMGMLDGIRPTGRTSEVKTLQVPVTTLDAEWERLGRPRIVLIKVDVEGAELSVLQGAQNLIEECRPFVVTEWQRTNLEAYHCDPEGLCAMAVDWDYRIYGIPGLARVKDAADLSVQMLGTESFLLAPEALTRPGGAHMKDKNGSADR